MVNFGTKASSPKKSPCGIGDDQKKIKRPLLQGLANTSVHCINVSVLRGFAVVAFGDLKISINYNCLLYIPYNLVLRSHLVVNFGTKAPPGGKQKRNTMEILTIGWHVH